MLVSIVIPVLRDTQELLVQLDQLGCLAIATESIGSCEYEVIVSNGDPASPAVGDLCRQFPRVRWMDSEPGRAQQMNAGARLATGRWLLFLHADVRLEPGWLEQIQQVDGDSNVVGGCFTFKLDSPVRIARVIEAGVRWRVRWLGLAYGDQGLFVRRAGLRQAQRLSISGDYGRPGPGKASSLPRASLVRNTPDSRIPPSLGA